MGFLTLFDNGLSPLHLLLRSLLLVFKRPYSRFCQRWVIVAVSPSPADLQMDLDTQTLKECRLGPIVLFYTKTKRVTPAINRQADALVQAWSRPIIKRPANLRSRYVETLDEAVESAQRREGRDEDLDVEEREPPRRPAPVKRKRFDVRSAVEDNRGKKGARLFINRVSWMYVFQDRC